MAPECHPGEANGWAPRRNSQGRPGRRQQVCCWQWVAAGQAVQQKVHRLFADLAPGLADGRQRGGDIVCARNIIKTDDRKFFGHPAFPQMQGADHTDCGIVIVTKERRRQRVPDEQPFYRRPTAFTGSVAFNPTGASGGIFRLPELDRPGRPFPVAGRRPGGFGAIFSNMAVNNFDGWAVVEWECCLKHPEDGAREGAQFVKDHIIRMTEKAFDDFADTDSDDAANRRMLGI
jgi:hypothetical protein